MKEYPFQALIHLVEFDQSIVAVERTVASVTKERDLFLAKREALMADVEAAHAVVFECNKAVHEQELVMKDLDAQERMAKERLETAANNKQYVALQGEIVLLKKAQHDMEQHVLSAWSRLEMQQASYALKKEQVEKEVRLLQDNIACKQEEIDRLVTQINNLRSERPGKVVQVAQDWLDKYEHLGSRVSDPVVAIDTNACPACSQELTSQDIMRLKRGALLQCRGCFRLLYLKGNVGSL